MLVIVVHDGAEEHIVALAVGHVIGAAQGEAHAVDRAAAGLQEGNAGVEAGGHELIHILEPGVLALFVDQLEAFQNHIHSLLAEELGGHGLAVGAQEGLGGVDQGVDGGAGEGLVGQGLEELRDQAHLVGDDVVGHQAQLGLAAGEHTVLLVLDDSHRDVGALRAGAAGGGDGDDVLLVHHGESLEVQVVDGIGALAAQQLAQVHNGAAAHGDDAVVAVVGDGVVHDLDHFLAGLAGTELLLEYIMALEAQILHEGGIDELVGQHHVPLVQLELLRHLGEGLELVHCGSENNLPLVSHQGSGKSIHDSCLLFKMIYGDTGRAPEGPRRVSELICGRWPS